MWELDYKEGWVPKNWSFQTGMLEEALESPLDCKECKLVNPKGNQPWIFFGRSDAEAGTPILWPPDTKNWLIRKDPDAGKDWGQEEKRATEDGWMASLTWWTWVWIGSGSWWWTGKPSMLQSMEPQLVGHDWVTELNWFSLQPIGAQNLISTTPLKSLLSRLPTRSCFASEWSPLHTN